MLNIIEDELGIIEFRQLPDSCHESFRDRMKVMEAFDNPSNADQLAFALRYLTYCKSVDLDLNPRDKNGLIGIIRHY